MIGTLVISSIIFAELKIFAFILSLYILLLTGIPCCAFECKQEKIKMEHPNSSKQDQEKNCCNCCSPFFGCQNCGGFIVQQKFNIEVVIIQYTAIRFAIYKHPYYPEYSSPIWQPPQLP
jgi:hypothetical protein